MTISEELLEKYLLGEASLLEVSQVKKAAESDPELAEKLLVAERFNKMIDEEEFEELPLQRMAAASQDNMCVIQCERRIIQDMRASRRGRTLLTSLKEEKAFVDGQSDPGKEAWIRNLEKRFPKKDSEWLTEKGTALFNIGRILEENGLTATRHFMSGLDEIKKALSRHEGVIVVLNERMLLGEESNGIPDHAVCVLSIGDNSICLFNPSTGREMDEYPLQNFFPAWETSHKYAVMAGRRGSKKYNPHPKKLLKGIELPDDLNNLAEALSEFAHDTWAEEKIRKGYRYGPTTNDDKTKGPLTHRDLRPYSELTEAEKVYDRDMSDSILKLVKRLGFTLDKPNHTCPLCGKPVYLQWRYCSYCGHFLELSDFLNTKENR